MAQQKPDQETLIPLTVIEVPLEEKQRQLEGRQPADEQNGTITPDETDSLQQPTLTQQYEGELEAGMEQRDANEPENLELLTELELRAGETDDAFEAAEEGLVYIPPIDPPTTASDNYENAQVASGMGTSAMAEPYNREHHSTFLADDDEVSTRVREALRADSATTSYADWLDIETWHGTVTLRGVVADLDDSDHLLAVTQRVEGVREVVDHIHITAS